MNTKIDPNAPAFPTPEIPGILQGSFGLPIRLELAARMACGLLACQSEGDGGSGMGHFVEPYTGLAATALGMADALIAAYNESQQ